MTIRSFISDTLSDLGAGFLVSSLNAPLLVKVLENRGVEKDVIYRVIDDLQQTIRDKKSPIGEQDLIEVFSRHRISDLAGHAYDELRKDPPVLSYGTIGMF